jgi:hypothetical protein
VWGAAGEEFLLMLQDGVDVFLDLVGRFQVGDLWLRDSVALAGTMLDAGLGFVRDGRNTADGRPRER